MLPKKIRVGNLIFVLADEMRLPDDPPKKEKAPEKTPEKEPAKASEGKPRKKRMIIMVGGPATGKGFFLGEPDKIKKKDIDKGHAKPEDKGKRKKGTGFGTGLPKALPGLFDEEDVSHGEEEDQRVDYDESDSHLRVEQRHHAEEHYAALKKAHDEGPEAFKKALADHWYNTKDGQRRDMSSYRLTYPIKDKDGEPVLDDRGEQKNDIKDFTYENFPDSVAKFREGMSAFYVSMRGWHDDCGTIDKDGKFHPKMNPKTGKIAEPLKDRARDKFEEHVKSKMLGHDGKGTVILDSAGEDIDVQDFEGQIKAGRAAGYEVSIVMLDMDKDDAELSNMKRGFIDKKRMVDQSDIDNFWKVKDAQIEKLRKLAPDRFIQMKRNPPMTKEERETVKKAMSYVNGKPTAMIDPKSQIKTIADVPGAGGDPKALDATVGSILYKPEYEIDEEGSTGISEEQMKKYKETRAAEKEKKRKKKEEEAKAKKDAKPPEAKKDAPEAKKEEKKEDKDLSPEEYFKVHERCPDGYRRNDEDTKCVEHKDYDAQKAAAFARKVARATLQIRRIRDMERTAMEDKYDKLLIAAANQLAKLIPSKVRDYEVVVSAKPAANDIQITLKGGGDDITALKMLRPKLIEGLKKAAKTMGEGYKFNLTSHNVGDDMVLIANLDTD